MNSRHQPLSILGDLNAEEFLTNYWQKKPLLIRQALPGYRCPVSPNELAGLSLETEIESRVILENGMSGPWELHKGPFEETFFSSLPTENWTLLVQQLDAWVPEIAQLLHQFSFIPNWRVDDIMASYAPKGGSVGPHFDLYDVFLLQAEGQRKWQIGQWCDDNSPRVENTPLNVLQEFQASDSWILEPGDMLYLPPRMAHWGVAENDCITLSIGFRAPDQLSLLNRLVDLISIDNSNEVLLSDPELEFQTEPGEISLAALSKATSLVANALQNRSTMAISLGEIATELKNEKVLDIPDEEINAAEVHALLTSDNAPAFNEGSRFAFIELESQCILFVDGAHFPFGLEHLDWIKPLSRKQAWPTEVMEKWINNDSVLNLIAELINQGSLYID